MIDIGQPRWWPLTGILGLILIGMGGHAARLPAPRGWLGWLDPLNLALPGDSQYFCVTKLLNY